MGKRAGEMEGVERRKNSEREGGREGWREGQGGNEEEKEREGKGAV